MIFQICIGLFGLIHVAAITYAINHLTGPKDWSESPFKTPIAAILALVHVVIETGWAAALALAFVMGAAMANQPLPNHNAMMTEFIAYVTIPVFVLTLITMFIVGKTKTFKLGGWAVVTATGVLIAVDLVFNAGAGIAATTFLAQNKF